MNFRIKVLRPADRDVDEIVMWLCRKRAGMPVVARWVQAYEAALDRLKAFADQQPFAPEDELVDFDVRQVHFKTRRGRSYRILFTIVADEVRVMRVRGPGQDFVPAEKMASGDGT